MCRTVLCVFNLSQDVCEGKMSTVFHCFCPFTFVSISCDIDNFVCFLEKLYRNFSFNSMVTCGMSNFLIAKAKHDC